MRQNKQQVLCLIEAVKKDFSLINSPIKNLIVHGSLKNENMAEWTNIIVLENDEPKILHFIRINFALHTGEQDLKDTIAHELIHAWQYENNLDTSHDVQFLLMCIKLAKLGYNCLSSDCLQADFDKAVILYNKAA